MKIRLVTLIAIVAGYYFGSKAGEQRYQQILWLSRTVANSQTFHNLLEKIKSVLASAVEAVTGQPPEFAPASQQGQQS